MLITLQAKCSLPLSLSRTDSVPLSVTIRPANSVLGSYEYQTDSAALLKVLRHKTDLSGLVLEAFRVDLQKAMFGRLQSVKFDEQALKEIGYLID